jgi:hypothetical protein
MLYHKNRLSVWLGLKIVVRKENNMTGLRKSTDLNMQQQVLRDTLERIREHGQSQFSNPLKVQHCEPDPQDMMSPFYFIAEICKTYWLGIIPRKKSQILLAIRQEHYVDGSGRKVVHCTVYHKTLLDIVEEQVQKYANEFQIDTVHLTQNFVR